MHDLIRVVTHLWHLNAFVPEASLRIFVHEFDSRLVVNIKKTYIVNELSCWLEKKNE